MFIDEAAFSINLRRTVGWSRVGSKTVVEAAATRAKTHTVLGAICAAGVVQIGMRSPPTGNKKRKLDEDTSKHSGVGTNTHHYIVFLNEVMNTMDQHPEFEGYYLVMDNAPIHQSKAIDTFIRNRGYRCMYLPPYSPELNPIEQFWSIVKSKVRRDGLKKDYEFCLIESRWRVIMFLSRICMVFLVILLPASMTVSIRLPCSCTY